MEQPLSTSPWVAGILCLFGSIYRTTPHLSQMLSRPFWNGDSVQCAWCTLCPFYHIYSDWRISVPFSDSIRTVARFPTSVSLRKNLSLLVRLFGLSDLRGNVFRDLVYVVSLYHIYDYIR